MPPRHGKSLLASVFWPAWVWASHPEIRWLFASYDKGLATRDSVRCRRLIESPWYKERWGSVFELTTDQNVKTRYENDRTGFRISTSCPIAAVTGEGGDCNVLDDPLNALDAHSETSRHAIKRWIDEAWSSRINDPATNRKLIIMQRLHQDDPSAHVLEGGDWEHLCLPAEKPSPKATSIGFMDPRNEDQPLWPEKYPKVELDKLRRSMGPHAASGQLDQDPAPVGGSIVKESMIRYWVTKEFAHLLEGHELSGRTVLLPESFNKRIQAWDMNFKADGSSFAVGQQWGAANDAFWLLDQYRKKPDFLDACQAVRDMCAKHPGRYEKVIEDAANGPACFSTLKGSIPGLKLWFPRDPEATKGKGKALDKTARLYLCLPEFEALCIYVPHPDMVPWAKEWVEEITYYPKSRNDDQVDTTTLALLRLRGRKIVFV